MTTTEAISVINEAIAVALAHNSDRLKNVFRLNRAQSLLQTIFHTAIMKIDPAVTGEKVKEIVGLMYGFLDVCVIYPEDMLNDTLVFQILYNTIVNRSYTKVNDEIEFNRLMDFPLCRDTSKIEIEERTHGEPYVNRITALTLIAIPQAMDRFEAEARNLL